MTSIELLVDCRPGIGWGHFIRSAALAEEMQILAPACQVHLRIRGAWPEFYPSALLTQEESAPTWDIRSAPDAVVVDGDRADWSGDLERLPATTAVIRITDGEAPDARANLTISPNFGVPREKPGMLAGPSWIILRPAYDAVPERQHRIPPLRVLVCLGGDPPARVVQSILDVLGLELAPFPIQEVVVVAALALGGPHAAKRGYRVMYPVSDMFALMIEADIGIVGAGTLLYETMATGLPAVAVSLTEDQAREAEFVSELGSCVHVRADDVKTKLGTALARLASTPARRTMSDVGRRHLDGGGRRRSAEAVLAVAERTAGPLFRGSSK